MHVTPTPIDVEEHLTPSTPMITTKTHQVKRPAEHELEGDDDDKMVQVLQVLQASESDLEEKYNEIMLENGEWCPAKLAWEGDVKEVQGLFDKQVFVIAGKQRPQGRHIPMRMIRRWKGDFIKSRLCLQDVARDKPSGGELYAATPSLTALRAGLALASGWRNTSTRTKIRAIAADVTQAFVHADMDEKVIARVPQDMNDMII